MVGQTGVEPVIAFRRPDLQSGGFADSLLTHIGGPCRARTGDLLRAKQALLPTELKAHRLTLCVKTDKAFATPNSVRIVMV